MSGSASGSPAVLRQSTGAANVGRGASDVDADLAALETNANLLGNPTVITQTAGNNSTRIANTAFIQAALAALVDSSPVALDTLNELAAALGDDANFATTMTNALAGKEPSQTLVTQAIAEAGTSTVVKSWSALRVAQAIAALTPGPGDHEVRVNTGNGYGSTNTMIRRFTTILRNVGTDITYADSATLGNSFTINETAFYEMYSLDAALASGAFHGISLNSTQLTTTVHNINTTDRLGTAQGQIANGVTPLSIVRLLTAGDVIRAHTDGVSVTASSQINVFSIRKVGVA